MHVRHRVLFTALAAGIGAVLFLLVWSSAREGVGPNLQFTLSHYTNSLSKFAVIKVTNLGNRPATLTTQRITVQGDQGSSRTLINPLLPALAKGASTTLKLPVYYISPVADDRETSGNTTGRWQVCCGVVRETTLAKIQRKLQKLPGIGAHISPLADYQFTSDWFSQ